MLNYLYQLPVLRLFFLLAVVSIIISLIAVFIVRFFVSPELRLQNNAVLGNISSLISIIYGVLVGLTALYLINNISNVDDLVQREVHAVANIYRDSKWLKEPAQTNLQKLIITYLSTTINEEWPLMKSGKALQEMDGEGEHLIDTMSSELKQYNQTTHLDSVIIPQMLDQLRLLYDARDQRIHASFSALTPEIWIVIFVGTILTIGINYLYGMNFYLHLITVSAVALMASSMIFLMIALDRPFEGEFIIQADSFQSLLDLVQKNLSNKNQKIEEKKI